MYQLLRKLLIMGLDAFGAFPTPMTQEADFRALVRRLHPIATERRLLRMGPATDGGYLVPDDLIGVEACFSPGVSAESGFEKDCADRGMQVFLADRSVGGPAVPDDRLQFVRKHIGATTDDAFMTMDDWVNASLPGSKGDLILQMDIEGCEYEAILSMSPQLVRRFRIIVVEFHWLDQYWSKPLFRVASRTFDKLLESHTCVHIHPNNVWGSLIKHGLEVPRLMEFTFLRRDRVHSWSYARSFPHPLDAENTNCPPLPLPACWYGG